MIEGDQKNEESLETCDEHRVKAGEEGPRYRAGPAEGALGLADEESARVCSKAQAEARLSRHA